MKRAIIGLLIGTCATLALSQDNAPFIEYRTMALKASEKCIVVSRITAPENLKDEVLRCMIEGKTAMRDKYLELAKTIEKPAARDAFKQLHAKLNVIIDMTNVNPSTLKAVAEERTWQLIANAMDAWEKFQVELY